MRLDRPGGPWAQGPRSRSRRFTPVGFSFALVGIGDLLALPRTVHFPVRNAATIVIEDNQFHPAWTSYALAPIGQKAQPAAAGGACREDGGLYIDGLLPGRAWGFLG